MITQAPLALLLVFALALIIDSQSKLIPYPGLAAYLQGAEWPRLTYYENYESEQKVYYWNRKDQKLEPYLNLELTEFSDSDSNRKLLKMFYNYEESPEDSFTEWVLFDYKNKVYHTKRSYSDKCITDKIPFDIDLRDTI